MFPKGNAGWKTEWAGLSRVHPRSCNVSLCLGEVKKTRAAFRRHLCRHSFRGPRFCKTDALFRALEADVGRLITCSEAAAGTFLASGSGVVLAQDGQWWQQCFRETSLGRPSGCAGGSAVPFPGNLSPADSLSAVV